MGSRFIIEFIERRDTPTAHHASEGVSSLRIELKIRLTQRKGWRHETTERGHEIRNDKVKYVNRRNEEFNGKEDGRTQSSFRGEMSFD